MSTALKDHYPSFVPNQVLTDSQLNELRDYLDQQDRYTRTHMIGCGIICGLVVSVKHIFEKKTDDPCHINISQGYGATSDGYIVELLEDTVFDEFREVTPELKEKWDYHLWKNKSGAILELFSTGSTSSIEKGVKTQTLLKHHVKGKIVVLFIEKAKEDLRTCSVTDCSNKGTRIHFKLRVLLVEESIIDPGKSCELFEEIEIVVDETTEKKKITPVYVPRLHRYLQDEQGNSILLRDVTNNAELSSGFGLIAKSVCDELLEQLRCINHFNKNEQDFLYVGDLESQIVPLETLIPIHRDAQEFTQVHLGFITDLSCAFNEFLEAYCLLVRNCRPCSGYECHLMLRRVIEPTDQDGFSYRHVFQPAPTRDVMTAERSRVRKLLLRLLAMIKYFDWRSVETLEALGNEKYFDEVKIIPSETAQHPLGQQAIPAYYRNNIRTEGEPDFVIPKPLIDYWQPAECCNRNQLLSYNPTQEEADAPVLANVRLGSRTLIRTELMRENDVNRSLSQSLLKRSFYRIDGHLGKRCEDAIREIKLLREVHNLSFDIVALILRKGEALGTFSKDELASTFPEVAVGWYADVIDKLTGVEHMAGVVPCGTLVLVCDPMCAEKDDDDCVIADFSLNCKVACCLGLELTYNLPVFVYELSDNEQFPVGSATVTLIRSDDVVLDSKKTHTMADGDEAGHTSFYNLPAGGYVLTATKTENSVEFEQIDGPRFITLPLEEATPIKIQLRRPAGTPGMFNPTVDTEKPVLTTPASVVEKAPTTIERTVEAGPAGDVLATRLSSWMTAMDELEVEGKFQKNRTFQTAKTFMASKASSVEATTTAFNDAVGRLQNQISRAKGPKQLEYHRALGLMVQDYLDWIVGIEPTQLSTTSTASITNSVEAMKAAGMDLSKFKRSWKAAELRKATGAASIKTIESLIK